MNNSSENNGRKILGYLFPGLITLLVMLIVLAAKGIWPFGSNRIDLFDNMQQVARCMHICDAMHASEHMLTVYRLEQCHEYISILYDKSV